MKASFVDLRTKSAEIIKALLRNERVTVLYRGKPAAIMTPIDAAPADSAATTKDHAAFGLWADRKDIDDVARHVRDLRQARFDAF